MAEAGTGNPQDDPSRSHLNVIVVDDPAPLPEEPAEMTTFVKEEFGEDAEAMQELLAEVDGIDPLTGEPFGEDPAGADASGALDEPDPTEDPAPAQAGAEPGSQGTGVDPPADPGKPGEEPAGKGADPAPAPEAGAGDPAPDPAVLAADGKNQIPYSVLQSTRDRANLATADLERANARIAELEAGQAAAAPGAGEGARPAGTGDGTGAADRTAQRAAERAEVETAITEARDEYGDSAAKPYEVLLKRLDRMDEIEANQERILQQPSQQQQQDAAAGQDTTQIDVDAVPTLALWQADALAADAGDTTKSKVMWDLAIEQDELLEKNPAWANRPQQERFQEVVRILGGDVSGSGAPNPSQKPGEGTAGAQQRTVDDALAQAAQAGGPQTLSDLPGASAQQQDGSEWETMDTWEVAQRFQDMSPEQMEAVLARTA